MINATASGTLVSRIHLLGHLTVDACQTPTKREFKFGFSSESFVDLHVLGFTLLNEVLGDKEDVIWSPAFSF